MDKLVRIFTLPNGDHAAAGPFHNPSRADEFGDRLNTEGLAIDRGSLRLETAAALERLLRASGQVVDVDPDAARCRLCGCTEDAACLGGCQWVTDAEQIAAGLDPMTGDLCTACLMQAPDSAVDHAIRALVRAIRTRTPIDFQGEPVPAWLQHIIANELGQTMPVAPLHQTEVYRLPAGSSGWRCSCGDSSVADVTGVTAQQQALAHRSTANAHHPAVRDLAAAIRAAYPAAAVVVVSVAGGHVRLAALYDSDCMVIPAVDLTEAAWSTLSSKLAVAYAEGLFGRGESVADLRLPAVPPAIAAARAEAEETYPPHVLAAGGPDHYAAETAQALYAAILRADWDTVRRIAADPYAAGVDRDGAAGALAGAGEPGPDTVPTPLAGAL
ncbi:hypothetical protein OOJ91_34040 [Micromonospora lupini]|uniref:hypothetical protein n=1 Tax=Micromonospora lupini TaxID=285679 RepID=UPI0022567BBB|nr:hypothetical protein [Micromonospora lupini]MCX5070870.1 hypothetical protein [Micromonospora lupini]